MIRSAELSGSLDTVLDQLTVYIEREVDAKSKIRSAMVYPVVIVVLSVAVSVLLVTFVLPKFQVFFASFDQSCRCRPGCCSACPTSCTPGGGR